MSILKDISVVLALIVLVGLAVWSFRDLAKDDDASGPPGGGSDSAADAAAAVIMTW